MLYLFVDNIDIRKEIESTYFLSTFAALRVPSCSRRRFKVIMMRQPPVIRSAEHDIILLLYMEYNNQSRLFLLSRGGIPIQENNSHHSGCNYFFFSKNRDLRLTIRLFHLKKKKYNEKKIAT